MIYTGNADGESLDRVESYGLGIMVASSATWEPRKSYARVRCALDNGAFQCRRRGFPFMEDVFLRTLNKAYDVGLTLDFIVCPDIVGGGRRSLEFSMEWACGRLKSAPNLALAVQDGVKTKDITAHHLSRFSHIFVGGSADWKWSVAGEWVEFAHRHGKMAHIGQCGRIDYLKAAKRVGADSVDSVSFVRNNSWHIIDEFFGGQQMEITT